jgi:glycosyltransferase involved in cell wall biosynthesis
MSNATHDPIVSVVLAVYNGEQYLRSTVESVLAQTLSDFELIIVNDGSTDASRDIALSFGDPRIRVIDNPRNLGLTPSLNRGLLEARGEFVARIDADDLAAPKRLARQVDFLRRRPGVGLVGTWYRAMDGNGKTLNRGQLPTDHVEIRWSLMFYCAFVHSGVMWRRVSVHESVGLYDDAFAYAMDWEYWSRIASRLQVANLGAHLTHYRVGPHSMSSTHPRVHAEIADARAASIRAVFGAEAEPWIRQGPVLFAIIDGWPEKVGPAEIRATTQAVRNLHDAFTTALGIDGHERRKQQEWLRAWMARRLLTTGRKAHLAGRSAQGAMLLREAVAVDPRCVATINFGRYIAARAIGMYRARRTPR